MDLLKILLRVSMIPALLFLFAVQNQIVKGLTLRITKC